MTPLVFSLSSLAWMLILHALCDYPLQGDWLAKAKNPQLDLVPGERIWPHALLCHGLIHAGGVKLATGSWVLAFSELVVHCYIDYGKCKGYVSYNTDQLLHFICKVWWAAVLFACLSTRLPLP